MKKLAIILMVAFSAMAQAQTGGDEESVLLLEDAVKYTGMAKYSSGSEKSAYIRKASVAANLACNFAESTSIKNQACRVAERLSKLVTFD